MIRTLLPVCVVVVLATVGPAVALEPTSTMSDWVGASAADRDALLELLGPTLSQHFRAEKPKILACIDRAAQSGAHAELPVDEIAKACAEAAGRDRGADQSNDI